MNFIKPDQKAIGRMTVQTVAALLDSLKVKRNLVVAPLDRQIGYYEYLLKLKQGKITQEEFNKYVQISEADNA